MCVEGIEVALDVRIVERVYDGDCLARAARVAGVAGEQVEAVGVPDLCGTKSTGLVGANGTLWLIDYVECVGVSIAGAGGVGLCGDEGWREEY